MILLRILLILTLITTNSLVIKAQSNITDTPIAVEILTSTPASDALQLLTPTATFEPTEIIPLLEASTASVDINVRSEPDGTSSRLGTLEQGRQYPVRGRYFSWFWFDYENSPTGRAWVFGDLVNIIGDASTIPTVDPFAAPTDDPVQLDQTATSEAIRLTPELAGSATADARLLVVPTGASTDAASVNGLLPTFTPPAEIVPLRENDEIRELNIATDEDFLERTLTVIADGELPPIAPIGILAGLGLLGGLISLVRRL